MRRIPSAYWLTGLCLVWLLGGLFGHAPWKGPDSETFAQFLSASERSDWLLPGDSAASYAPPLYIWLARAISTLLTPVFSLHDSVRLASGLLVGASFLLVAFAARRLYGANAIWPAVLSLMGCMGLLVPAHEINAFTAQLASMALLVYGLAGMQDQPLIGGGLAGLGLAGLFLSGAWLPAGALAVALLLLPLLLPSWRTSARVGGSWFALIAALALCGAWLMSVHARDADGLAVWWQHVGLRQTIFQMDGKTHYNPLYFINALSWFAWPAWLLAGWAVYRLKRAGWDSIKLWLPLGVFVVALVALSLQTGSRQIQAIILLPPLALLAGAGLGELRRGAANALLWFSFMAFSFFALVFWVYWTALDLGWPAQMARRLSKLGMESAGLRPLALIIGLCITFAWVAWLSWLKRQPRTDQRPILVWSTGVTFVWCLLMALFMGPLDGRLSYAQAGHEIKAVADGAGCIAVGNMDATHRQLLAYHSGLDLDAGTPSGCGWLLVQQKNRKQAKPGAGWIKRWEGGLPGERDERLLLYQQQS